MKDIYLKLYKSKEPGTMFIADIDSYYNRLKDETNQISSIAMNTNAGGSVQYTIFHVYHDGSSEIIESMVSGDNAHSTLTPIETQFEGMELHPGYPTEEAVNKLDSDLQESLDTDTSNPEFNPPDDSFDIWRNYLIDGLDSIESGNWKCIHEDGSDIVEVGSECSGGHTESNAPDSKTGVDLFNITDYMGEIV